MVYVPPPEEAGYYSIPSPTKSSIFSSIFPPSNESVTDPTHGRGALPRSPRELEIRENPEIALRDGKVHIGGEGSKTWVAFQTWQKKSVPDSGKDLVFIHGINDYGGKFAEHAEIFLNEGIRIIVPDLPSHGRSTGVHVHLPELDILADGIYDVLTDVVRYDAEHGVTKRKTFVAGQSMGGFTAILTCVKYGKLVQEDTSRLWPQLDGGIFLCPMLAISPESRPAYVVELIARGIASVAGPLPFAAANKGKNSEDPTVEEQFEMDPQTYHGKLRIATGLGILKAIESVNASLGTLVMPISVHHGTGDRVTSPEGSKKLVKEAGSTDKELNLYEGFEHILLRTGKDEQDDGRRQRVLGDMLAWLRKH